MLRWFDPLHGVTAFRSHWRAPNIGEILRMLSGRPAHTGDPEIDAILDELYSMRPQKF